MSEKRKKCGRKPGGKNRFVGLVSDAKELGFSAAHLHRVLAGRVNNPILTERYATLKRRQAEAVLAAQSLPPKAL